MTSQLPDEPPPSPESFGTLYKLLGTSAAYEQIITELHGSAYGRQLSVAGPSEIRLLANRAALAPGQRVADLAAGMGGPTLQLAAEYGCQLVAVDWSRQALLVARRSAEDARLVGRLRYVVGDFTQPLFADASFHAVVSIDGFFYVTDLAWLYREVFRILRPGGRFAFYFNVPLQAVIDASPPIRREQRDQQRIDHLGALAQAGFVWARAEERTFNEQRLLTRLLASYNRHFAALAAEIGTSLATDLRDEIAQTLALSERGQWPRYLFSARKPAERAGRHR